jgi:hypothetical protein
MVEDVGTRNLAGSSSQLVHHIETCDTCRDLGTRWCVDVGEICAVVRADRHLMVSEDARFES